MTNHKARQTARLIEATLLVIHRDGLHGVSVSKVAAEAGVTRQTVYNYFPDVESIVVRAIEDHAAAMEEQLRSDMDRASGTLEQLTAVADHLISNATAEHADLDLESGLAEEMRRRIATHGEAVRSELARAVAEGIDHGALDDGLDPVVAADLLFGVADGAARAAARHPNQTLFVREAAVAAMWAVVRPTGCSDHAQSGPTR